jgi:hypothetical protein
VQTVRKCREKLQKPERLKRPKNPKSSKIRGKKMKKKNKKTKVGRPKKYQKVGKTNYCIINIGKRTGGKSESIVKTVRKIHSWKIEKTV